MKMLQAAHQRMNVAPPAVLLVESLVESSSTTIASPKVTDAGVCPTSKFATAGLSLARFWMQMPGVVCRHIGWIEVEKLQLNESPGKNRKISQPKNRQRRGRGTLPPARSLSPVKTTQTKQAKKRSRGPTQKTTFQVTSGSSTAIYCHRNSLCNNQEMKLSAKGAAFGISEIVSCSINSCVRPRLCCLWQKIGTVPESSQIPLRSALHQSSSLHISTPVVKSTARMVSASFRQPQRPDWTFCFLWRGGRASALKFLEDQKEEDETVEMANSPLRALRAGCESFGLPKCGSKTDVLETHVGPFANEDFVGCPWCWEVKLKSEGTWGQASAHLVKTQEAAQRFFFTALRRVVQSKTQWHSKVLKLLKLLQESSQASKNVLPASPNKTSSAQTHK